MALQLQLPNLPNAQQLPARMLAAMLKVSSALASSLELGEVLQIAIDSTVETVGMDSGAIYLLEGPFLYLGATTPILTPEMQWLRLQPQLLKDHPHLHQSLVQGQPVYLMDARAVGLSLAERAIVEARNLRSILYIPLRQEATPIGVLIVGSTSQPREFGAHEFDLCRVLSHLVSMAVVNARLFNTVQKNNLELTHAYDATLQGWSLALELRDQDTQGHTRRVVQLTEALANLLEVPQSHLTFIRRGALLHDIGKMGIPDSILRKKGWLTPDEWIVMRRHPELAYQFLVHIDFLVPALDIPYCHHERWDGTGYPRGLKGEDIPLAARIFAVVDVYDAITSDRPYRPALPESEALRYIREQAGRHFDPHIARKFLNNLDRLPDQARPGS